MLFKHEMQNKYKYGLYTNDIIDIKKEIEAGYKHNATEIVIQLRNYIKNVEKILEWLRSEGFKVTRFLDEYYGLCIKIKLD